MRSLEKKPPRMYWFYRNISFEFHVICSEIVGYNKGILNSERATCSGIKFTSMMFARWMILTRRYRIRERYIFDWATHFIFTLFGGFESIIITLIHWRVSSQQHLPNDSRPMHYRVTWTSIGAKQSDWSRPINFQQHKSCTAKSTSCHINEHNIFKCFIFFYIFQSLGLDQ